MQPVTNQSSTGQDVTPASAVVGDFATRRVVLITGASAGIGRTTAKLFVKRGWNVAVTARGLDRLHDLAAECGSLRGTLLPLQADVTAIGDMERVGEQIAERFGKLDVVIANAGIGHRGALIDSEWDDLDAVLRTNIDGVLHTVRVGVPLIRRSGIGGHIVLLSSVLAQAVGPYTTIYSASKMAVNGIARGLREELRSEGIKVTSALVGQTHSEFTQVRRGVSGKTASTLPTMSADYVAERLYNVVGTDKRSLTLRPIDHLINFMGTFLPWVTDRLLARIYQPKG